ncbi:MAG: decaprenyl-phosphate phosphoribosyltransferase [Anaerolineales bacterium]|jgi:4-hydroxybenzoate polyprenyltransferase|nr:decaprenyl-phosphate phosphoribosyltransferase [Anaerolineales bacterium]
MFKSLLKTIRPRQWPKNLFIFAALIFDRQLLTLAPLLRTLAGFVLLCLASGLVYIINDLVDLPRDRQHPTKRLRPLASGRLTVRAARIVAAILAALTLAASLALNLSFGLIVAVYVASNLLYSFWLKHVPIIDVFVVASGFLLRVAAGVALLTVERFSPWLYVCTTLLALYIGFGKRRAELVLLADGANAHRRVLDGYTIPFLDQLIVIVSATTIVAYSLYTFSAPNLPSNHLMMLTIPFVLYGIFRYLYLVQVENAGGAPEDLFTTDKPLMATFLLWGLAVVAALYLGR